MTTTRSSSITTLRVLALTLVLLAAPAALADGWYVAGFVGWDTADDLELDIDQGTIVGGLVGARLTVLKGHRWVRGVVTVTIVLFALKLWFGG